jgi:hypothetical protein
MPTICVPNLQGFWVWSTRLPWALPMLENWKGKKKKGKLKCTHMKVILLGIMPHILPDSCLQNREKGRHGWGHLELATDGDKVSIVALGCRENVEKMPVCLTKFPMMAKLLNFPCIWCLCSEDSAFLTHKLDLQWPKGDKSWTFSGNVGHADFNKSFDPPMLLVQTFRCGCPCQVAGLRREAVGAVRKTFIRELFRHTYFCDFFHCIDSIWIYLTFVTLAALFVRRKGRPYVF